MKIDHVAIWADDIELLRRFYVKYFGAAASARYENPSKHYSSYFLAFPDSSTRLELMQKPGIDNPPSPRGLPKGLTHIAFSLDSPQMVDELTGALKRDGYAIVSEPRLTGDGCYESVVEDTEGNWVEIVAERRSDDEN
ncbi:MAG: VOC family protein [Tannerellaceae bacterium]|jgi:lactoylglutathione lyase|nr:VOC family protein [Tannerellaceae bacterium]